MAYRSERIKGIKIRVFKWEQNMITNHVVDQHYQLGSSSRFGFLVLTVKNQIEIISPINCCSHNHGGQTKNIAFKKSVQPFKICESPDEFVKNIEFALRLSDLFFSDTIPDVANTIFDYLSSSFEHFLEKLNLLGTNIYDDDEFHKIVVVIDVDMLSKQFGIGSQQIKDVCSFLLTDLYETLTNDGDNNDREGEFYLHDDRSSGEVSKKREFDVNMQSENIEIGLQLSNAVCNFQSNHPSRMLINDGESQDRQGESYLQVDSGVNKKKGIDAQTILTLEVEYTTVDPNTREILDTLYDFLTKKGGFLNKVEAFDGEKQELRELKSGLKILKLEKENVVNFELGEICPICLKISEEKSIVVITPCSHIFHRSCIFTWLSKNNTCPICRASCAV